MKKLLACGLILSTLMSFGSMGFAAGLDHEEPDLCCYNRSEILQGMAYSERPGLVDMLFELDGGRKIGLVRADGFTVKVLRDENGNVRRLIESKNDRLTRFAHVSKDPSLQSPSLKARIDAKGKNILFIYTFLNLGDGTWFPLNLISTFKLGPSGAEIYPCDLSHSCCENIQFKITLIYSDGPSDTIKYLGSELMDNVFGELDCGPVCLKDIEPPLASAFTPSKPQYYTVISGDQDL